MPKLQRIRRSNGSLSYSVNIPLEIIEQLSWKKGDPLLIDFIEAQEQSYIKVLREDELNEQEEQNDTTI